MSVFDVPDEAAARAIILTPEGEDTDSRWERETPYLATLIELYCNVTGGAAVLDFGCGIGRLSKALLTRGDPGIVAGLDASVSMRDLAAEYVKDPRFYPIQPERLLAGQSFDTALAVWVLQHVADPVMEVARVRSHLKPGGRLFVVNGFSRAVPGDGVWVDDRFDVLRLLRACFREIEVGYLDPDYIAPALIGTSFWGVYERLP